MTKIYAMSNIHGCLDVFGKVLSTIDLSDGVSKLVLLGVYCDRGTDSLGVFKLVMSLQVSGVSGYRGIWYDGASHYFIDANVMRYGEVAVLQYDSEKKCYSDLGPE